VKTLILTLVVWLFVVVGAQAQSSVDQNNLTDAELQSAITKGLAAGKELTPEYLESLSNSGSDVSVNLVQSCDPWQNTGTTRFCGDNICVHQCRMCWLAGPNGENIQECQTIKVFLE
jgi:hypothetical protein